MNNNAIYPSPLENLVVMVLCVAIGAALTKFYSWSINNAKEKTTEKAVTEPAI